MIKLNSLLKERANLVLFFILLGAMSNYNMGFLQWHGLAETLVAANSGSSWMS